VIHNFWGGPVVGHRETHHRGRCVAALVSSVLVVGRSPGPCVAPVRRRASFVSGPARGRRAGEQAHVETPGRCAIGDRLKPSRRGESERLGWRLCGGQTPRPVYHRRGGGGFRVEYPESDHREERGDWRRPRSGQTNQALRGHAATSAHGIGYRRYPCEHPSPIHILT
jgi:hypothetical protein